MAEAATDPGNLGHRSGLVPVTGSGVCLSGFVIVVAALPVKAVILLGPECLDVNLLLLV